MIGSPTDKAIIAALALVTANHAYGAGSTLLAAVMVMLAAWKTLVLVAIVSRKPA